MAEGSDCGAADNKPLFQGTITHRKRPHSLQLTESHLHWGNVGGKAGTSTTVPLSDVFSVQNEDPGHHGDGYFRVHYIHKRPEPSFIWKHVTAEFREVPGQPSGSAASWVRKITHQHAKIVSPRRPRRLLVFVNPVSGGSRGCHIYAKFGEPLFRLAKVETEVIVTDHSGHIKEHLMDCDLSSFDGVVVTGGDGTFTEACAGLLYRKMKHNNITDGPDLILPPLEFPVGIIPAGTGQGQVNRATGTHDPTTAVLRIIAGETYQMDSFCVHDDSRLVGLGTLLCGCGLTSNMIEASEKNRWLGRGRYAWGAVKAFSKMYKYKADVEIYLFQVHEDGRPNAESSDSEVIQRVRGDFLEVSFFCVAPQRTDAEPGAIYVNCFSGTTNRKAIIKHTLRVLQMQPNAYDFECLRQYKGYKYRIRIDRKAVGDVTSSISPASANGDVSQASGTSSTSARDDVTFTTPEGATYHLKPPDNVNIDGDPFPISGEWLQVKALANAIRMYGQDHKNVIGN